MKKLGLLAMAGVVMLSGCGGDDDEVEDLLRSVIAEALGGLTLDRDPAA